MGRHWSSPSWVALALTATAGLALAACGGAAGNRAEKQGPILIGASVSLSGDDAPDGINFEHGYELWANDVNKAGGLLGRQVKMVFLNDASSPEQVVTNYENLITIDHANLLFGPYSGTLTGPAAKVANRYHMALPEGAGAGSEVFGIGLHNVFLTGISPNALEAPLGAWLKSMPASKRPTTAAYATSQDPFTEPQVQYTQKLLEAAGIKTVDFSTFPAEPSGYKAEADAVAATHAQVFILGSNAVDQVSAFVQAFIQDHYNPEVFLATAGPDQGTAFVNAIGAANTAGMMVPNTWYSTYPAPASKKLVAEYIAKYGGNASGMSTDIAQAYTVGEVTAEAVDATHSLDGQKLIDYMHSKAVFNTVVGPLTFNSVGESETGLTFIQQWQHGNLVQILPPGSFNSVAPVFPKPNWGSGS